MRALLTPRRISPRQPCCSATGQPDVMNRGLAGVGNMTGDPAMQVPHGAVVLPALYGTGMTTQVAILLSVADDFGDPRQGMGGDYKLIPAMTGYKVTLHDNMGDALPDPATEDDPVFGGTDSGRRSGGHQYHRQWHQCHDRCQSCQVHWNRDQRGLDSGQSDGTRSHSGFGCERPSPVLMP